MDQPSPSPSPDSRPSLLELPDGSRLAYRHSPGLAPTVVFLGGYSSDMTGTKAVALEHWCAARRRASLRLDYGGHGASSGRFVDGTIGSWSSDAVAVISHATQGPLVLVGSSMGGWVMLLAALALPGRVCGLVGIAAAPDFTEEIFLPRLSDSARRRLLADGVLLAPNPYGPEPTPFTLRLVEEGKRHLVLGGPIPLSCPVRLLHGLRDPDVPWNLSVRLAQALESPNVAVTLLKDGDHRLSDGPSLEHLFAAVDELCRPASTR